ncbi:hypothetical protein N8I77_008917 [Diaporthe amygdali]|uniref:Uncharacterized protein n=1 Tax=Phomopsis amygdali TaxID=1214568 RepID=A0AAD9S8R7_PHOAM|nr:hypothetical protein N8I77_008917 [Diaporthe amygdali]
MEAPTPMTSPTPVRPTDQPLTTSAPLFPVFLYGARPLSLDASLIAAGPVPDDPYQSLWRFQLACPTGSSSSGSGSTREENPDDQCLLGGLFPAELYHTQGSIYGGTFTPRDAAATTWRCELGSSGGDETMSGDCSHWESEGAASTTKTALAECDVVRHSVPVRVTDGVAKETYYFFSDWSPSRYNSVLVSELSSLGCPNPTSLVDVGAVATLTSSGTGTETGPAVSATGSTLPSRTTGASADGTMSTSGGAPTETASVSAASRSESVGPAAFVCVLLACASAAGLLAMPLY